MKPAKIRFPSKTPQKGMPAFLTYRVAKIVQTKVLLVEHTYMIQGYVSNEL